MRDVVFDGFACRLPSIQLLRYGVLGDQSWEVAYTSTMLTGQRPLGDLTIHMLGRYP
jgi:hypothetical protein